MKKQLMLIVGLLAAVGNTVLLADVTQDGRTLTWPDDPPAHWVSYHLAHPDPAARAGDPNPALYYKGRYHLHYHYIEKNRGIAMAHVSSTDMVHWKWHPTVLRGMLSGTAFLTKEGKPAIIYGAGNIMII